MMSGMAPPRPRSTRVTTDPDQYVRLRVVPGDLWRAGWVVVGVLAAAAVLRWVLADGGNVIFTLVFSFIASVAWPYLAWYALSYGGRMTRERRIDGINLLVLRMLEDAGGRRLPRPTGMLVPAGYSLSGRDR